MINVVIQKIGHDLKLYNENEKENKMAFIDDKEFEAIVQDKDGKGNWVFRETCGKGMKGFCIAVSACEIISRTLERDCRIIQRYEREVKIFEIPERVKMFVWDQQKKIWHRYDVVSKEKVAKFTDKQAVSLGFEMIEMLGYSGVKIEFKDGKVVLFQANKSTVLSNMSRSPEDSIREDLEDEK
jgi:hypothetical protein